MRSTIAHWVFSSESLDESHSGVAKKTSEVSHRSRSGAVNQMKPGISQAGDRADRPTETPLSWLPHHKESVRPDGASAFDRKQHPEFTESFDPSDLNWSAFNKGHHIQTLSIYSNIADRTRNSQKDYQSTTSTNHRTNHKAKEPLSCKEIPVQNPFSKKTQLKECKFAETSSNEEDFKLVSRSTTTQNKQQSQKSRNSISPTPSPTKIQQRFAFKPHQLAHTSKKVDCDAFSFHPPHPVCRILRPASSASQLPLSPEPLAYPISAQQTTAPGAQSLVGGSECTTAFLNGKYKVFYRHLKRLSTNSQLRCNRMLAGQDLVLRSECRESIASRTTQSAYFLLKLSQMASVSEDKN